MYLSIKSSLEEVNFTSGFPFSKDIFPLPFWSLVSPSRTLKDFALYISNEDGVKLHTVRDRLAYARKMEWIKKPGVGIRTSYMKKEK